MWRQKRKSIQELKRSAGLPIEADESVLMWGEWKGRRSEKHKCCIYSRFPNPTFSQLGNLRSRQRMTLRTNRAKHFTAHTSPLIICLYHLAGSPFPNIYHYLTTPFLTLMKCCEWNITFFDKFLLRSVHLTLLCWYHKHVGALHLWDIEQGLVGRCRRDQRRGERRFRPRHRAGEFCKFAQPFKI